MGTWGSRPWESDEAADWLAGALEGLDLDGRIEDALRYDDSYGPIRAAAYLLRVLGHSPYVWPGDWERRRGHVDLALARLRAMAAPGSEYRKLWSDDPELLAALSEEIAGLEAQE